MLSAYQQAARVLPRSRSYKGLAVLLAFLQLCMLASFRTDAHSQGVANGSDTKPYIGHLARLTAQIPSDWTIDPGPASGYSGTDGFVFSRALPAPNLETACTRIAANGGPQYGDTDVTYTEWHGIAACEVTGVRAFPGSDRPATVMVFEHPYPFDLFGDTYRFATIAADPAHFPAILSSLSFDPDRVTSSPYAMSVLEIMESRSIYADAVDWQPLWASAEHATTWATARLVIRQALIELREAGDYHSGYYSPATLNQVAQPSNFEQPQGRRLDGNIGYLQLPGVWPTWRSQYIQATLSIITNINHPPVCGWILDLRRNSGGSVNVMIPAIGPLMDEGRIFGYRYPNGNIHWITHEDGAIYRDGVQISPAITPPTMAYPHVPVAVLVGPGTTSSGEFIAIAFMGANNARLFGSPTRGLTTANRGFPLIDGYLLNLAVANAVDRTGHVYTGSVVPDKLVASHAPVDDQTDDPVISAAIEWLDRQSACNTEPPLATPMD